MTHDAERFGLVLDRLLALAQRDIRLADLHVNVRFGTLQLGRL
jgi:hypothetical protein